jgi:hypothetical protein
VILGLSLHFSAEFWLHSSVKVLDCLCGLSRRLQLPGRPLCLHGSASRMDSRHAWYFQSALVVAGDMNTPNGAHVDHLGAIEYLNGRWWDYSIAS